MEVIHPIMKSNIENLQIILIIASILILGGTGLFAMELLPRLIYFIEKKNIKTSYLYNN